MTQGPVQQVSTFELKGTGESVNFALDLAKLLIQCLSLGIIQGAVTGLYGQFPAPVYQIGDTGQSAVGGAEKLVPDSTFLTDWVRALISDCN